MMNRKKELRKPQTAMPQGGQMSEAMLAIMPDFPKWNRLFFSWTAFLLASVFY